MRARVLVVEDDVDELELLAELLEQRGYAVSAATSIHAARVEIYRAAHDVVVADLLVDTKDLARSWRSYDDLAQLTAPIPIALMSGWRVPPNELAGHRVSHTMIKPFNPKELLAWLANVTAPRDVTEHERAVVASYFAHLSAKQWDAFVALCTDDVTYQLPGEDPAFAQTIRGRDELRAFAERAFRDLDDVRYDLESIVARPAHLTISYTGTWSLRGEAFRNAGAIVLRMRDGAIASIGVRFDPRATERAG